MIDQYHMMLTFIVYLAAVYAYSDKASCSNSSLISFTFLPLNTCTTSNTTTSMRYTCSNGTLVYTEYNDSQCTNANGTYTLPTYCQDGYKYTCASEPTPTPTPTSRPPTAAPTPTEQSYVIYQTYSDDLCTAPVTASTTTIYVQDLCVDEVSYTGSYSYQYNCNNDVPYYYYYASTTCTGTPSEETALNKCERY